MPYVLTRPTDGRYYNPMGWRRDRGDGLRFASKQDALDHVAANGMIGVLAEMLPPEAPPGTAGVYDPFGIRTLRRD